MEYLLWTIVRCESRSVSSGLWERQSALWEESDVILLWVSSRGSHPPIWKLLSREWRKHVTAAAPANCATCWNKCISLPSVFFFLFFSLFWPDFLSGVTSMWLSWTTCRGSWLLPRTRRRPWIPCYGWPSNRNWPWLSVWRTWSSTTSRRGATVPQQWAARAN